MTQGVESERHDRGRAIGLFVEKIVTPAQRGIFTISPLEIVASAVTIGLLMWLNDASTSSKIPLLIPPFAASTGVIYTQPGMSNARAWNVIAGQFLGGLAGFLSVSIVQHTEPLAAGLAVGLALLFMRVAHALHPPALATALLIVLVPTAHGAKFLIFPILAGAVIIVVVAWLVHLFEIGVLHRLQRALGQTPGWES